jgi:hypothetical protein
MTHSGIRRLAKGLKYRILHTMREKVDGNHEMVDDLFDLRIACLTRYHWFVPTLTVVG